ARDAMGETLRSLTNVSEVTLNQKETRLEEWKVKFGEDAVLLDGYEENNPLRDWYKVRLLDLSLADETAKELEAVPGVAKLIRNQDTIDKLVNMTGYLGSISVWVMIFLTIASVFIISNTIKLTVYARRKEINIMKFVGATDWFIRWPFIIEGIIIGLFGAVVTYILVSCGYQGILGMLSGLNISFVTFKPFGDLAFSLAGTFLLMGVVLGGLGSLMSVRKHLKV
ncbi:MAG: ABC transporter permease, partial [Clostridia bacterium]|nr:ABC transporter permease [Clostridia bacterium]